MTTKERIAELENNCKAMTAEIEKLKAELTEKGKSETVWTPQQNDLYMYINSIGRIASNTYYLGSCPFDNYRIDFNNAYRSNNKTQEHLEWYRDNILKVQNKLMQLHELLCPDYCPNWNDGNIKWFVYYDCYDKKFEWDYYKKTPVFTVYFTQEAAEKACEILNREKFMMK